MAIPREAPRHRRQDLRSGLKQYGDDIYLEPGRLDHVADRFAAHLLGCDASA